MSVPDEVVRLCERFSSININGLSETEVRVMFINPLFHALGWDVTLKTGRGDVVHEDRLTSGSLVGKTPDYGFYVGSVRKFFVEAKRPAVDLATRAGPAYQLRRYAWSAGVPVSVLTDFEEFAVYDCRPEPQHSEAASAARVGYWRYDQYADDWAKISALFHRDSVVAGSIEDFAGTEQRGSHTVGAAFLRDMDAWRKLLATELNASNPGLSVRQLNRAVQLTLDRIVFLRIAEDRGAEQYGRLQSLQSKPGIYARLCEMFERADAKYNSGLFHFRAEAGRHTDADTQTLLLRLDDAPLTEILGGMYFPAPYAFSVIPSSILGQVYERFLGKVVMVREGAVKIEDKPEVRKAGGVHYTPDYVVDYIVERTLGPLLQGKTPRRLGALRVLDPSCGSGSFLLGAYRHLLDWHLAFYTSGNPERHGRGKRAVLFRSASGAWRLSLAEKRRILLSNIYGVDIDAQAVEVTKLSLLLKVLEGEGEQVPQARLIEERALPDLHANIKCGNALIGPDYFHGRQLSTLSEDEILHTNAFDWHDAFPKVFADGGFSAVIGNPPYRRERDYKELMDEIAGTEFGRRYKAARMDFWYYFVHRALATPLLREGGRLGYIVNAYWLSSTGSEKLIGELREQTHIDEIFYLDSTRVFERVAGRHMILLLTRGKPSGTSLIRIADPTLSDTARPFFGGRCAPVEYRKTHKQLYEGGKLLIERPTGGLIERIERWPELSSLGLVRQGIAENPSTINRRTNKRFGEKWSVGEGVFALTASELDALGLDDNERPFVRPYYDLCDLGRYRLAAEPSLRLLYLTKRNCPDIKRYPRLERHLGRFREVMEGRRETRSRSNRWWHLHWPREASLWPADKILSVQMSDRPAFVASFRPTYVSFSVNVFVRTEGREHLHYLTALLNSRLLWVWYQQHAKKRGVNLEINGGVLRRSPVRTIDFDVASEVQSHDRIVAWVEELMALETRRAEAGHGSVSDLITKQIAHVDNLIDAEVYALYGLTDEQIATVQSRTR